MGILKFLGYRLKKSRSIRPCSASSNLGIFFDNDDNNRHSNYTNDDMKHFINKDGSSVRSFSWDEMVRVTGNFSRVIGCGGFSHVYLAQLQDGTLGAIKTHCSNSERLYRVFKQELDILLHIDHHDHIVDLLGYYDDQEKGLLVLEYIDNGTLQEKLHDSDNGSVLSWTNRMQIAYQMAQAIEHLHERCSPHIVHGDIKSSNILLDNNFNSKLCDFGSAKMGISSPFSCKQQHSFLMTGSPGYVDPHYLKTGVTSKKNDIYSFGVLILELVTGMEPFSARTGKILTSLVNRGTEVGPDMVDTRLDGNFDFEEAMVMLSIAELCLGHSPTLRPSASDLVFSMQHQIPTIFPPSKLYKNV